MNYKRLYDSIIFNAVAIEKSGYTEKHHIVPKSLGGLDNESNLVKLTAREHFICHYLLTKMYGKNSSEWHKMHMAFHMMKCSSAGQERYFNSRLYEATRENRSLALSLNQSGENSSQRGTMWINNGSESKKMKKDDLIPDGWIKGRVNVHSDYSKSKVSLASKGRKHTEASKIKMSSAKQNISEETKEKMSAAKKGRKLSEEHKAKLSAANKGKIGKLHTEETKIKIGNSSRGRKHTEETKDLISKKLRAIID